MILTLCYQGRGLGSVIKLGMIRKGHLKIQITNLRYENQTSTKGLSVILEIILLHCLLALRAKMKEGDCVRRQENVEKEKLLCHLVYMHMHMQRQNISLTPIIVASQSAHK